MTKEPLDRASFYDEQARHRRASRVQSVVCGLGAVVLGAPLAVLATPLLVLVLAGLAQALPSSLGLGLAEGIRSYASAFDRAVASEEPRAIATSVLGMMLPGMLGMLGLWIALRRVFGASGSDVVALALEAREPKPEDLEERQLENVFEEMAVAAGVPPPSVKLVDAEAPNAAAVGGSVVIVTRGVLDALDRAETQALAAHLVSSTVNGDPRLAASIYAFYESLGLLLTLLDAVFGLSPSARRELATALRCVFGPGRDARAAAAVARVLARSRGAPREDGLASFVADVQSAEPQTSWGRAVKRAPFLWAFLVPLLLLYVVSLLLGWQVYLLRAALVEPAVHGLWRSRRYLADAVAVQLTRQPDALKSALERLAPASSAAPWADALFVIGSPEASGAFGPHPSLERRCRRLVAMGATETAAGVEEGRPRGRMPWWGFAVAAAVVVPLSIVAGSLALYVLGMSFLLALAPAVLLTAASLMAIASFLA